ncbi:MAG: AarF/ABC1/UbiB kinase family protein [Rhodocyclaceae bacterium]|nr:AarF/ABC1/UbiB kinase family protein [Rhodocyclaceae bacterium]
MGTPRGVTVMAGSSEFDRRMLDALGIAGFMPPSLAHWTPLLLDGLWYFLGELPQKRRGAIILGQMRLPADAAPARRLATLLGACPTLHKLGQVVARHRGLPAELRVELQALESLPPASDPHAIRTAIVDQLPAHGAPAPNVDGGRILAEGSVAAVLPFDYRDGDVVRHGVFKVLRPGVEEKLAEELAILVPLADLLQQRAAALGLGAVDFVGIFAHVRLLLARELRLDVEQANMAAAASCHADDPDVVIPRLLPGCGPRLTVMERVFGCKLPDAPLPPWQRRRLARKAVSALVARPFWSAAPTALIHGDPHGGNLLATEDGRLAVIDWSLVASLSKSQREAIVDAALGGMLLDGARIADAVVRLGGVAPDDPRLGSAVDLALAELRRGRFPGADWLLALLDRVTAGAAPAPHQDLLLFRKAWLTIAGVIADLDAEHAADPVLIGEGIERWLGEWPARMLARPDSRLFATHLSNIDLMRGWADGWLWPLRFYGGLLAPAIRQS